MILIITDNNDYSTCEVIDWLDFFKEKYIFITDSDFIETVNIDCDGQFSLRTKEKVIKEKSIKAVWYRRGFLNYMHENVNIKINKSLNNAINQFLKQEKKNILEYVYWRLSHFRHINSLPLSNVNKLIVLDIAKKVGFRVPNSIVTNNMEHSVLFSRSTKHGSITKAISPGFFIETDKHIIYGYTEKVSENEVGSIRNTNHPNFFQELIPKKIDLRVFVLQDNLYPMAIFSQNSKKTLIDFRKYDNVKPNRTVPIKLPKEIEKKILKLMKILKINCGSIDLIYSSFDEFVFLELNPIGQFGMVSKPCNYQLEMKIAKYLCYGHD